MSTDHRSAVVLDMAARLADAAGLAGVQVEPGWPGDDQAAEAVWVDEIENGSQEAPASGPATLLVDDEFTIPVEIRCSDFATLAQARARLGVMCASVLDTLRAAPDLGDLEGDGWELLSLLPASRRDAVWRSPAGPYGAARIEFTAHVRLTSET